MIAASSLFIGSSTALLEVLLVRSIDSILPNATQIKDLKRQGSITILSTNQEIIQKIGPSTRTKLRRNKIQKKVEKAFIAAGDRRFYSHQGLDFIGIVRALITNFRKREYHEGVSTSTQQ